MQFLNTNKSGEMTDILKTLQNKYDAKNNAEILYPTILHGDQLTEERACNVQWTYRLSNTAVEHLEDIQPTLSQFHLKMCLFEVREKVFLFFTSDRCKLGYILNKETIKQYFNLPY